jgi:sugar phosphate isomerase/epimerase
MRLKILAHVNATGKQPSQSFFTSMRRIEMVDKAALDEVGILATPLEFHSPKLPDRGDIVWDKFFSTLNQVGYDGDVCIEVEDRDFEESLEGRQEALRQSANFLRTLMTEEIA